MQAHCVIVYRGLCVVIGDQGGKPHLTHFLGAESVCQLFFHKTKGLLRFLDIKNVQEKHQSSKDVRTEGFEILRDFLEKMDKKNLSKNYAHVTKYIKDICLDTYMREKHVKDKAMALEPLSVLLRYSKGTDVLSSEEAVKLFKGLLYNQKTAQKTSTNSNPGVKKAVFTILGRICKNYPDHVCVTTSGRSLLVEFLGMLSSYIDKSTEEIDKERVLAQEADMKQETDMKRVLAGCFDGLSAVLESLPEEALAFQEGELLKKAYVAACDIIGTIVPRYVLPIAALNLIAKHSRHLCQWFFKGKLGATKMCGRISAAIIHHDTDVKRAAVKAMDSWLGCLRHCTELGAHSLELANMVTFLTTEFSAEVETRQVVIGICGYGALAFAMRAPQDRCVQRMHNCQRICVNMASLAAHVNSSRRTPMFPIYSCDKISGLCRADVFHA
jgi:hypothetical protein